jgi:galactonate dehydratase
VACTIVEKLLRPAIVGEAFDGSASRIEELWDRMYATMRVRGHAGGFMLDAMSGIDIALWDLAGKIADKPVCRLIAAEPKRSVPAYLSGTSGATPAERAAYAARFADDGFSLVKLYYESDWADLLAIADGLPHAMRFAVDALWHLPPVAAIDMARELDARRARWLECPLYPEEIAAHAELSAAITTPIAVGESYRTLLEMEPFFGIAKVLQPDLGEAGAQRGGILGADVRLLLLVVATARQRQEGGQRPAWVSLGGHGDTEREPSAEEGTQPNSVRSRSWSQNIGGAASSTRSNKNTASAGLQSSGQSGRSHWH